MAVSVAHIRATKKYRAKTYDTIGFDVPKGKREEFKAKAAELGFSLAKFLFIAAESYGVSSEGNLPTQLPESKLTSEQKRLVEEFSKLPIDTQKSLMKFIKTINDNQKTS